jgi:hypothetical protein
LKWDAVLHKGAITLKVGQHHFLKYHKHSDGRKKWDGITKTGKKWAFFGIECLIGACLCLKMGRYRSGLIFERFGVFQ